MVRCPPARSILLAEVCDIEEPPDHHSQADRQQQHVPHGAQVGGSGWGCLEELGQPVFHVVHLVVDAEEGEDVEELVAVPHDVEQPWLDPLGDFADIEEGGHQQPEVAAVEVDEKRGVARAEVEDEALQHDGAGHAQRHGEDEGAHSEGVGAAGGAAAAAGGRAAHGQRQGHGQHQGSVGRDGQAAVQLPAQLLLHVAAQDAGIQQAQPRQQVVGVGHGAGEAVVADGGVVQVEEGGAEARGEAAEEMGRAAHGEGEQHPRGIAPEGQQGRVVEGHVPGPPQQQQPAEAAEEEQQRDEVGPEVERLVGGLQHGGQALLRRAVQPSVAREDEALHEVLGHLVPAQQGGGAGGRRRLLLVPLAPRHAAPAGPRTPGSPRPAVRRTPPPPPPPPPGRGGAAAPAAAGGGAAVALRFSSSAAAPGSITHCSTGSGGTAAPPPAPPPGIAVTGNRRRVQRARGAGRDAPAAPVQCLRAAQAAAALAVGADASPLHLALLPCCTLSFQQQHTVDHDALNLVQFINYKGAQKLSDGGKGLCWDSETTEACLIHP
ncbi:caskin-1-like isoform X1 [Gallus gallus]|uniref:caskin-1-like isoform X1 n=1 Tax=Gallus gallus TaxID=9031 RepID=UPI001F00B889|nr:caskin-1-like isoform X1 [Gallus gallus]XP_046780132.1 caskin-1-like isoform X1 [Gallus gallus]